MATWEAEILRGELAQNIKCEYRKLLSVNKDSADAERLVVEYFMRSIAPGSSEEGRLWLALALCEWKLGRLSPLVKDKACEWAPCLEMGLSAESVHNLLSTLDSPMPEKKRIRPPAHVAHCPWPVGSLLAYRIISSEHPHVAQSPFYGKYVLLRVVMIKRYPITRLAPDDGWDERMLVGLYDWIGDAIPNPEIANRLSFTAVSITGPTITPSVFQHLQISTQSDLSGEIMKQLIHRTTTQRTETCCDLSWKCARGIRREDVFTYLGYDPVFQDQVSPFFKTDITDYSLCHSIPFDSVLVNRFMQLLEAHN